MKQTRRIGYRIIALIVAFITIFTNPAVVEASGFVYIRDTLGQSLNQSNTKLPEPFNQPHGPINVLVIRDDELNKSFVSYCCAYGMHLNSGGMGASRTDIENSNNFSTYKEFSEAKKEKINLAMALGFNESGLSKNDQKDAEKVASYIENHSAEYRATQVIIWTIAHDQYDNTTNRNKIRDAFLPDRAAVNYFNNIVKEMKNVNQEILNINTVKPLNWNGTCFEAVIKDPTGELTRTSSNKYSYTTVDTASEYLKVTSVDRTAGTITVQSVGITNTKEDVAVFNAAVRSIKLTRRIGRNTSADGKEATGCSFYQRNYGTSSREQVTSCGYTKIAPYTYTIDFYMHPPEEKPPKVGGIVIKKTSSDGKISGIVFHFQDKASPNAYDIPTNENGICDTGMIFTSGTTFIITENMEASGLNANEYLDPTWKTEVSVPNNSVVTISKVNTPKEWRVALTKNFLNTSDYTLKEAKNRLSGAIYSLYNENGLKIEDIKVTNDLLENQATAYGEYHPYIEGQNYYIKETYAPNALYLDTNVYSVEPSLNSTPEAKTTYTITSEDIEKSQELVVLKKDKETGAIIEKEGFKFKLEKRNEITGEYEIFTEKTTDENGCCEFGKVPAGDYKIQETECPNDEYIISTEIKEVTISPTSSTQEVVIIEMFNQPKMFSVTIEKEIINPHNSGSGDCVDSEGKFGIAKYVLYDDKDHPRSNPIEEFELQIKEKTDGTFTVEKATSAEYRAKQGVNYYIKEVVAPKGCTIDPKEYNVTPNIKSQAIRLQNMKVESKDYIITQPVSITKINETTGKIAQGLHTFEIVKQYGNQEKVEIKQADGSYKTQFTTDPTTGKAEIGYLPYGVYKIYEVQTEQPFIRNKNPHIVVIDKQSDEVIEIKHENPEQYGSLQITKHADKLTSLLLTPIAESEIGVQRKFIYANTYIEGVTYIVRAKEEIKTHDLEQKTIYKPGELIATLTTDEKGQASIKKLPLGKYTIQETNVGKNPDGSQRLIVLDDIVQDFEIKYSGELKTIADSTNYDFNNKRPQAIIEFKKVMENDPTRTDISEAYKDVVFGLYTDQDIYAAGKLIATKDTLLETANVKKNGYVTMNSDIPFGSYYIKEIQTNKNYILDSRKHKFEFNNVDQTIQVHHMEINDNKAILNVLRPPYKPEIPTPEPPKEKPPEEIVSDTTIYVPEYVVRVAGASAYSPKIHYKIENPKVTYSPEIAFPNVTTGDNTPVAYMRWIMWISIIGIVVCCSNFKKGRNFIK